MVPVFESLTHVFKIGDIKRATGMLGAWEKMSEHEMMETWDAILAQERKFWGSPNLKQFGKPVSAETQVVAGNNYRFKFADGTIVPVFESLTHVFKIGDIKFGTGSHEQSDKSNCHLNECGCEPPLLTIYRKDQKSG